MGGDCIVVTSQLYADLDGLCAFLRGPNVLALAQYLLKTSTCFVIQKDMWSSFSKIWDL